MKAAKLIASSIGAGLMALSLSTTAYADGYSAPAGYARPFSWSGLYIGVNAGWVDENVNFRDRDTSVNPNVIATFCPTIVLGGSGCDIGRTSGIYGVHAGLNHQMHGGLVVGLEGAISWTGDSFGSQDCINGVGGGVRCEARTNFLATIGPRLGFAMGNFLIYGSGGFAHGQIDTQITQAGVVLPVSTRGGHDGWYLGVGLEYAMMHNVILGIEYQHIELNNNFDRTSVNGPLPTIFDRDVHADYDIVRARLSYKFGIGDPPRPLK